MLCFAGANKVSHIEEVSTKRGISWGHLCWQKRERVNTDFCGYNLATNKNI